MNQLPSAARGWPANGEPVCWNVCRFRSLVAYTAHMTSYIPVSDIDIVVPFPADAFLKEVFEAWDPHPTES